MQAQTEVTFTQEQTELHATITHHITITLPDIAIATKHTLSDYYDPILDSDIQPDFLEATDTVTNKLEEKIDEKIYDELAEERITTTIVSQRSLQELIAKVMEEALGGKYLYVQTDKRLYVTPALLKYFPNQLIEFSKTRSSWYKLWFTEENKLEVNRILGWLPAEKVGPILENLVETKKYIHRT